MAFPGLLAVCLPTVLEFSGQSGDVDWFVREAVAVPVPGSGAEFMAYAQLGPKRRFQRQIQWHRAVPGRQVVEVGDIDRQVLFDQLVAERDTQRLKT